MKKVFKKNQIIITALAVMIAVAGYINYSDFKLTAKDTDKKDNSKSAAATQDQTILEDIQSLDYDLSDETVSGTPGEAVLTGASTYMAEARISREQLRAQNKEVLNGIINNSNLSEEERQQAVASMVAMTELVEKEAAAELLLEAKGFGSTVVNLTGDTADVVIPKTEIPDDERAQIEDIVKRKTGIAPENIVITPMTGSNTAEEATDDTVNNGTDQGATGEQSGDGTKKTDDNQENK